jgi:flagellum-specific peptidoglycan hydrolase FlgJ
MQSVRKPRWQQATALVSLSTCGAMTGFSLAHGTVADLTSPAGLPVRLMASTKPTAPAATGDKALRAAIVKAANYYLRIAQRDTPAQVEALIWQSDSTDGVDHGESCAAFASLTLETGARATGQQSWVTGGSSYPWPLQDWADARVDPNPDSLNIVSILQDAETHNRWHPLGDGYTPQPGDWVLFDGHVEVVTMYSGGVLDTIGGDSMPNLSVNAHHYDGPLGAQGVTGFVNNGELLSSVTATQADPKAAPPPVSLPAQVQPAVVTAAAGQAAIPGLAAPAVSLGAGALADPPTSVTSQPTTPRQPASLSSTQAALFGAASVPGSQPVSGSVTSYASGPPGARYSRSQLAPATTTGPGSVVQQAFISEVAPGALAAQREYGVPAAVTIAQAIDESGWGQSQLALQDKNLFGIKGTGPAGTVLLPTQEFEGGEWVTVNAPFRVYSSVAQSITDHTLLLATSSSYKPAMANRLSPDTFAYDLTGVYATDPSYGSTLIGLMRSYNLYRFDAGTASAPTTSAPVGGGTTAGATVPGGSSPGGANLGLAGLAGTQPTAAVPGAVLPQPTAAAPAAVVTQPTATAPASVVTQPTATLPSSIVMQPTAAVPGLALAQPTGGAGSDVVKPSAKLPAKTGARVGAKRPGGSGGSGSRPTRPRVRETAPRLSAGPAGSGGASIPGVLDAAMSVRAVGTDDAPGGQAAPADTAALLRAGPRNLRVSTRRYVAQMPRVVTTAFVTEAKTPLLRSRPLYQDVATSSGIRWELLAACDWMQCKAEPRYSPVTGEKLGARTADGSIYRTKSEALEQCAADLIELASVVYLLDLTGRRFLSVRDLAKVFAAFRWGGLLKAHHISAMEFPYSVEGLTEQHQKMRWPDIGEPQAPDKPGTRFRMSFGAVPVVLSLGYAATA